MFDYFRGANIVKTRKLHPVIERSCPTMEFITQMEMGDAEAFRDALGKFLRTIDEFPNTDARGDNLGKRMFTITPK